MVVVAFADIEQTARLSRKIRWRVAVHSPSKVSTEIFIKGKRRTDDLTIGSGLLKNWGTGRSKKLMNCSPDVVQGDEFVRSYRLWLLPVICFMVILTLCLKVRLLEAAGPVYVVAAENALLRDNPSPDSAILAEFDDQDQVEFLDNNGYGWWKVRSLRTGVSGWMTADLLTAPAPGQSAAVSPEYYYVNTASMELHSLPLYSSDVTGSVKLNDRVEKLGSAPGDWTKVRNPKDGKKGWLRRAIYRRRSLPARNRRPRHPKGGN